MNFIGTFAENLPRSNFGPRWSGGDAEDRFADAFVGNYDRKHTWIHSGSPKQHRIMFREVPVNGLGIADLVSVSWASPIASWRDDESVAGLKPTVRAFEFKLADWRRGLMQAHRYRFFADVSVLVLPSTKVSTAGKFLPTFHALNVGFWGFNENTGAISMLFTPRPRSPSDTTHRLNILTRVFETAREALPSP